METSPESQAEAVITAMGAEERKQLTVLMVFDLAICLAAKTMMANEWRDTHTGWRVMLPELIIPALKLKLLKDKLYIGTVPTADDMDHLIGLCGDAVSDTLMHAMDGNWVDAKGDSVMFSSSFQQLGSALHRACEHKGYDVSGIPVQPN